MKKSVFLMIIVVCMIGVLSPFHALSQNILNSSQQKKAEKVLNSIWKKSEIEQISLILNNSQITNLLKKNNLELDIRKISINQNELGWVIYHYTNSMYDKFLSMIVYDLELNIIQVNVLDYPELYGEEITDQEWLRKFNGRNASENLKYITDLDAISGATLSANNLIENTNYISELMIYLKNNNFLK